MDKAKINYLKTGVPGMDEVLGGGLPEYSFNIIAGAPGSGKTTLAHQLMFAMTRPQHSAIYFTVLGEPPLKMLRYQQQFEFFDSEKVNHLIHFVNLSEDLASGDLAQVLNRISGEVATRAPALVFIDSFRSVLLANNSVHHSFLSLQNFIQQLGLLMTSWQATTFLIGEYFADNDPSPVFTVADGMIWLRQSAQRNSVVRKLEISKLRGAATLPGLHTFRMTSAGVHVFAPAAILVPSGSEARQDLSHLTRVPMGVPGLDEMLGGGLPRGYSLLVAGPSGSGKSILAEAFLSEGARLTETGVLAAFEQRPNRSRGARMAKLITDGSVSLIDTPALNMSVDEIAMVLVREVHRLKATRVVIDSLSGFELALAPTFREDFRESLARMILALASSGVTVLMTSELEDRYDDLRFSPYGTAFLTDAIIVQRYIEIDSQLRRVVAAVKVRSSKHSKDLRLYDIDDEGIKIGQKLPEYEGLLGGRPRRRLSAPSSKGNRDE